MYIANSQFIQIDKEVIGVVSLIELRLDLRRWVQGEVQLRKGPSKTRFIRSLSVRNPRHPVVDFEAVDGYLYQVMIETVSARDILGTTWWFTGTEVLSPESRNLKSVPICGVLNTRVSSGFLIYAVAENQGDRWVAIQRRL